MIDLKSTHVYREIHEQPYVLERLLKEERGTVEALAAEIKRRDIQYVVIAARGTSDNAGRYAQYLLGAMNGLYVGLATPSLFTIYDGAAQVRQRARPRHQSKRQEPGHRRRPRRSAAAGCADCCAHQLSRFRPGPGCRLRHRPARR